MPSNLSQNSIRLEVDAVIVQDLGVAKLVRENFPSLRLHVSTQLAVHNASGVVKAAKLGFKRVVLARNNNDRNKKNT